MLLAGSGEARRGRRCPGTRSSPPWLSRATKETSTTHVPQLQYIFPKSWRCRRMPPLPWLWHGELATITQYVIRNSPYLHTPWIMRSNYIYLSSSVLDMSQWQQLGNMDTSNSCSSSRWLLILPLCLPAAIPETSPHPTRPCSSLLASNST